MAETHFIVLDCPFCRTRVRSEVIGKAEFGGGEKDLGICVTLARCPSCSYPLIGYEEDCGYEESYGRMQQIWSTPMRIWPSPELKLSATIPRLITTSLQEAQKCLLAGAYTASVAMTGRALEATGRHFTKRDAERLMLGQGLEEMYKAQIIDRRLHEWGKELQKNRNLAAHASGESFERDDAEDLFNFATAICEYVFVLTEKFEEFKKRQADKRKSDDAGP